MGRNTITGLKTKLFDGVPEGSFTYFVHSFYASLGPHTIATTDYIQPYSAGLHRDNFYGVQFHPEKSAAIGERIIRNFLSI
jgi:glutamine amidotransferase